MEETRISLCRVNRPDKNNNIWMKRLADCIDGRIVPFYQDKTQAPYHDNRGLLFCNNGPQHTDNIGFWKWTEYQKEDGSWFVSSEYQNNLLPIEILILENCQDVDSIIEKLKTGVHIPAYVQGRLFFAVKHDAVLKGVLCSLDKLSASFGSIAQGSDVIVTIKDGIFVLPYYEIKTSEVFEWESRRVYNRLEIADSQIDKPLYSLNESIKQILLQRLSWPVFKAEGINKSEWRKVTQLLKDIPDDSMFEQLSRIFAISVLEARENIDSFLHQAEQYIKAEDMDSALIVKLLECHDGLKQRCYEIAYKKWKEDHKKEVSAAQAEIEELKAKSELEIKSAEDRLSSVQKAIAAAEKERFLLVNNNEQAQKRLEELHAEIHKYEELGKETVAAVQQRIADAQNDMAHFIAEISVLPSKTEITPYLNSDRSWKYICAKKQKSDDIEIASNWSDELNILSQNLSYSLGVQSELSEMLAAFLFAAYINKLPLLIVGPGGQEIADCFSSSLYGCGSGKLILGKGNYYDIEERINSFEEPVISVHNMFGEGWTDEIPQLLGSIHKQVIWMRPYAEDMLIEPKGLYNYMLPVISEAFIETISDIELLQGNRADDYIAYSIKEKKPLRVSAIRHLGISKLVINRLEQVITDAKELLDNTNKEKDMELLFGIIPFAILTGNTDILSETLDNESGISNEVKSIVSRYYNEE